MIRFFMCFSHFYRANTIISVVHAEPRNIRSPVDFQPSEVGHIHALKSPRLRAARWAISHPTVTLFVTARVCLRGFESLHDWGEPGLEVAFVEGKNVR